LIPAKFLGHKREENIMKKKRETEKKKAPVHNGCRADCQPHSKSKNEYMQPVCPYEHKP
jgi:hypothetical protein